jgi:hypothetical protein
MTSTSAPAGNDLGFKERMHAIDDVTDSSNALEFLGIELPTGQLLERYHEIDGVDAVEVKILVKARFERHLLRRNLEHLFEICLESFW